MTEEQRRYLCAWQKKCYEAGLVACDYPKEYGGGGHRASSASPTRRWAAPNVPYLINVIGLGMAAPTILHHGTEEQKRRYLPPLFSADEIWCQGFSSPAPAATWRASRTSPCATATTGSSTATRCGPAWPLRELDDPARPPQQRGQVQRPHLLHRADRRAKGVTVRPLIKMTGADRLQRGALRGRRDPRHLRLDDVGKGWKVAMTTLLHERGAAEGAGSGGGGGRSRTASTARRLAKREAQRQARPGTTRLRDRIVRSSHPRRGLPPDGRRARVEALIDHPMRIPLQAKLLISELDPGRRRLALEIEGAYSSLYLGDERAPDTASGRSRT
jgi:alkylation response protein AidB-like acyl-CoA dehydrogenase